MSLWALAFALWVALVCLALPLYPHYAEWRKNKKLKEKTTKEPFSGTYNYKVTHLSFPEQSAKRKRREPHYTRDGNVVTIVRPPKCPRCTGAPVVPMSNSVFCPKPNTPVMWMCRGCGALLSNTPPAPEAK